MKEIQAKKVVIHTHHGMTTETVTISGGVKLSVEPYATHVVVREKDAEGNVVRTVLFYQTSMVEIT